MLVAEMTTMEGEETSNKEAPDEAEDEGLLQAYVSETEERLQTKAVIRNANQTAQNNRPSEAHFSKLDSNLKKNTAFVKKIKNFIGTQLDFYLKVFFTLY